jgi:hypothetical protein
LKMISCLIIVSQFVKREVYSQWSWYKLMNNVLNKMLVYYLARAPYTMVVYAASLVQTTLSQEQLKTLLKPRISLAKLYFRIRLILEKWYEILKYLFIC